MNEEFKCPRRNESVIGTTWPGPDKWWEERDRYHMSPTCSYCGSISQEAFFAAIEAGYEIGPTDKSYKVYVEVPNNDPTALRVNGGSSPTPTPPEWGTGNGGYWKREGELTPDEFELAKNCGWGVDRDPERRKDYWINFGPSGSVSHGKFYFQHFDELGRKRFLDLVNNKRVNFGYPGFLYATPYFAKREQ